MMTIRGKGLHARMHERVIKRGRPIHHVLTFVSSFESSNLRGLYNSSALLSQQRSHNKWNKRTWTVWAHRKADEWVGSLSRPSVRVTPEHGGLC